MIQSMTGYGKEVIQLPSRTITIEIKSLNSRGLDLNCRIPPVYREKEMELRDRIARSLERGKIDFTVFIENTGEEVSNTVNEAAVKNYIDQLSRIVDGDRVELLKMAVRMPDSLKVEREEIDEEEFTVILGGIDKALEAINRFRSDEGSALQQDFLIRIQNISKILEEIIRLDSTRIDEVRDRLRKAVSELKEQVDENRFEQELIYYLEKYDITEEITRLQAHLQYFEKSVHSEDSNGKKLNFITQEIGREINTIGSKANYAQMQQLVVQMKDELEKIKEQTLNVL